MELKRSIRGRVLASSLGLAGLCAAVAWPGLAQDADPQPEAPLRPQAEAPLRLAAPREVDSASFTSAGSCATCHASSENASAMRDAAGRSVAPYDLWQGTMMANAARDPLWRAVVSAEVAATPSRKAAIEAKCLRCHSPIASTEGEHHDKSFGLDVLYGDDAKAALALDGVSCTVCHQIQPQNLGKPESFSGHFEIKPGAKTIYGPHADPIPGPMRMFTGFTPREGAHLRESALCATCHTLFTEAVDAAGELTGEVLPEQTPYLEWRNSSFNTEGGGRGMTCQDCHVPTRDEAGVKIKTRIAHAPPGGDFPFLEPRVPFGRHVFVGGNTLVPAILRDHRAELQPRASDAAFGATIAAARAQLEERTARISFEGLARTPQGLSGSVSIQVFTGHKFPTAHPTRRAWLQLIVSDASGRVLFASGAHDAAGRLLGAQGQPLPSELAGGPATPHRTLVRAPEDVPLYEALMADSGGELTYLLTRGASFLKDSRLLPRGWSAEHPDAPTTAPRGLGADPDFGPGGDRVRYELSLPASAAGGPLRVEARLLYQVLGARYAAEVFRYDTPEVRAFRRYYEAADRSPVVVASASQTLP